ncbi:MAG: hypothetical protein M3032_13030 [Verrucomicrobiota bacterium]|nr:hypothetical protein [Verrucomicrobiota bacterium]
MNALRDFVSQVSIVVSSCDSFFDAWRPFAFFFRKQWPDCPFAVHLITNHLDLRSDVIRALRVGDDKGWASNMQVALQQIATPYILYFQEDYFLTGRVDNEQLARDIEFAIAQNAAALSFFDLSALEPQPPTPNERYIPIPRESKGRTRLQTTLWNSDALASILVPGETAWDMEARGSRRTVEMPIFVYARTAEAPIQYLMSGIVRSLWTPEARTLCRAHGLQIQPHFRSDLVHGKWRRRWARAVTRTRYRIAFARQKGRPVEVA